MQDTGNLQGKLDYLVQATGLNESELLIHALQEGLDRLYQKHMADEYLAGKLSRAQAVEQLGIEMVEDLDYARRAIERDIVWGLNNNGEGGL